MMKFAAKSRIKDDDGGWIFHASVFILSFFAISTSPQPTPSTTYHPVKASEALNLNKY
jgi:hypothetical protein